MIILIMLLSLLVGGEDFVDDDGNLNMEALMTMLNDPNRVVVESASEGKHVDIPMARQWLDQPTVLVKEYPPPDNYAEGGSVEWRFENDVWSPSFKSGGFHAYSQGYLKHAYIPFGDNEVTIIGEFRMQWKQTKNPSCDLDGGGGVNYADFARWAAGRESE